MAVLHSDLPPAYSTLNLTAEEEAMAIDIEHITGPIIGKSFEDKNARVMFTQKVLCIFILQSIAVGVVLGIFAYYRIVLNHDFIGVAAVLYLITIFVMACIDHVKSRKIYNYIMLVYYPIAAAFVIVMVPTVFNVHLQSKLRHAFLSAWMSYILAGIVVLFYCIFSLDCKHGFMLMEKFIITVSAFIFSYFGIYIPLFMDTSDFDPISTLWLTAFLYAYFLYVIIDIDVMTSGHYRSPLTPADYVTGAVNMQIDFLFIIRDFIKRKCCCCCCGNGQ